MGRIRKFLTGAASFGAAGVLALAPAGAVAQTLDAVTADQLEDALEDAGLSPDMMADEATGAPVAAGKAGQFGFYVRALSCSGAPQACETLVFFANFELGRDVAPSDYRIVNGFNDSQVFGRAYVLEGTSEVGVDYVIELDGGVTEEHLSQNISRWADVISAFVSKFQEGEPTS
ncbi:YbjN domain-containing protein [Hyphococcus luteus]|nr:YbjN domain-containing protein [Marinicaulis flavus]